MSSIRFLLVILLFPCLLIFFLVWFIYWKFFGKKQLKKDRKRQEFKKKLQTHLYNFAPSRLKNRTWQKSTGKLKKKHKKPIKSGKIKQSGIKK
ncbi:hypothetical protein [endosymbiont GvMRE of Glomus versiforme]|uniref:hypothetical protein n=1 Tax=endosymbiont GvMRE of Glomus versiforme TaxID=2039283 RepID=UPI0011C3B1FC|nr:hypothetical protein [endosymbiont GvMRE of Glomus versiforme]